jgi:hypothetical protein
MAGEEFRRVFLPYCIERVEGHGHVVLNRLMQPLGMRGPGKPDLARHAVKFRGLTPAKAEQLSHNRSGNVDHVYLYADGEAPTINPGAWEAYQRRLEVLAAMEFE